MESVLRAAEALTREATHQLDEAIAGGLSLTPQARGETAVTVSAAKVNATRVALEVTSRVFEVQGARATANRYGFDRRWRDVRTHTLHDPVAYKVREVGDLTLNGRIPEPDLTGYR